MRHLTGLALLMILAGRLPAVTVRAEEARSAASIYNQLTDDLLMSPQTRDGARSRLLKDPQARTGYALVADPADKPGDDFSDGNVWYGDTYQQGAGKIRGTFRVKVADNTVAKPVVSIRGAIFNGDLKSGAYAVRELKGTDFTASNTYQEFSVDLLKGEQGFADWCVRLLSNATVVSFDGVSVKQVSRFDMAQLLELINPPVKPAGLTGSTGPFLVHETHGLYMELWGVRQAVGLLPEALRAGAQWTQSYLRVHPQKTALTGYPTKWEDLYRYRVVTLDNVPAKAVTIVGTLMLKQYVEDGGCLIMMGDTHGLVPGKWMESVLGPLLPVEPRKNSDLVHLPKPLLLGPGENALRGLNWAEGPYTIYYHRADVRPGATVLLASGEIPLIVERRVGKGRIIVLLTSVYGEKTQAAGMPFWEWKDWPRLMASLMARASVQQTARNSDE